MLRVCLEQQFFGLSDEGVDIAIYRSHAIRSVVGVDLDHESAPNTPTNTPRPVSSDGLITLLLSLAEANCSSGNVGRAVDDLRMLRATNHQARHGEPRIINT
jgi:hypothetical protein